MPVCLGKPSRSYGIPVLILSAFFTCRMVAIKSSSSSTDDKVLYYLAVGVYLS